MRFTGGSEKNIGERLKLLWWHGYLVRPKEQASHIANFVDLATAA